MALRYGARICFRERKIGEYCVMHRPLTLKRTNDVVLSSTWSDGFVSSILLSDLREACPCAHCAGEEIMGQTVFIGMKTFAPGMNELAALNPIGNYGVQAAWKDAFDPSEGQDKDTVSWRDEKLLFKTLACARAKAAVSLLREGQVRHACI